MNTEPTILAAAQIASGMVAGQYAAGQLDQAKIAEIASIAVRTVLAIEAKVRQG